jgi:hypothetical protein
MNMNWGAALTASGHVVLTGRKTVNNELGELKWRSQWNLS